MKPNRWARVAAGLAIVAGGGMVAAPAAQASPRPPANAAACFNTIVDATSHVDAYDIRIAGEFAAAFAVEGANTALKGLASAASTECVGLESYIGADLTGEQSQIASGLQSIAQGQWTDAADRFDQAISLKDHAANTLWALLHPTS